MSESVLPLSSWQWRRQPPVRGTITVGCVVAVERLSTRGRCFNVWLSGLDALRVKRRVDGCAQ